MMKTLTVKEVAQLLHLTTRRTYELAAAGKIPSVKPEGLGKFLFLPKQIAAYIGCSVEDL